MFLDGSYFTGELALPQLATLPAAGDAIGVEKQLQVVGENTLEWFIARYEEEFLRAMLGDRIFEAFRDGLDAETPAQIWIDLKTKIYRLDGGFSFSPAANYVYFRAMGNAATDTAMTGEVKHTGTYDKPASGVEKQVKAWNDMCDAVNSIRGWVFRNRTEIEEAIPDADSREIWCGGLHFRYINAYGI